MVSCGVSTRVGSCAACSVRAPAASARESAGSRIIVRAIVYKMNEVVTRPLLIIFLTIFVNLVGFGIIIPLLPFYAETFGASPLVIGLLFAVFSLCQLVGRAGARRLVRQATAAVPC